MSWTPIIINEPDSALLPQRQRLLESYMQELAPYFTEGEKSYLKVWVQKIVSVPFDKTISGVAGAYIQRIKCIMLNSACNADPEDAIALDDVLNSDKFTLAHELAHPIFGLAGRDGIGGYLIISPSAREDAQKKARDLFPTAIADIDAYLNNPKRKIRSADYSPQKQIAMLTYLFLDERYYDLFGSALRAKETGRGYTAPNRNHEIACNLRGLKTCEMDVLGMDSPGILKQIAGDIMTTLDEKVIKALANPNRAPFVGKTGTNPPPPTAM